MKKRLVLKKKFRVFLLIYLFLFTSYSSLITLSKYLDVTNKNGTVGIAKWDVSLDTSNSNETLNIITGNNYQNYTFRVTSTSEIATSYTIILSMLPDDIEVSIDGGAYVVPVDNKIEFSNVGSFKANDINTTNVHTLTFSAPINFSDGGEFQINMDVIFVQEKL